MGLLADCDSVDQVDLLDSLDSWTLNDRSLDHWIVKFGSSGPAILEISSLRGPAPTDPSWCEWWVLRSRWLHGEGADYYYYCYCYCVCTMYGHKIDLSDEVMQSARATGRTLDDWNFSFSMSLMEGGAPDRYVAG